MKNMGQGGPISVKNENLFSPLGVNNNNGAFSNNDRFTMATPQNQFISPHVPIN